MISDKALIAPLSTFIREATGEVPFPAKENITAPKGDFISIDIVSASPESWTTTAERYLAETGAPEYYSQYVVTYRITAYGGESFGLAHTIAQAFKNKLLLNILSKNGFGYQGHSEVRDASVAIDNTRVEKRYTLTARCSYTVLDVDQTGEAGCIETVAPPTFVGEYFN